MFPWYDIFIQRIGEPQQHRVAVMFQDITERKQVEESIAKLIEQLRDQDRRKDEFLATLAHELRNPLAPMNNGLQLMRLAASNPATLEHARAMMERQLQQMKRLVDDLMDVSRTSRNKLELRKEFVELATWLIALLKRVVRLSKLPNRNCSFHYRRSRC